MKILKQIRKHNILFWLLLPLVLPLFFLLSCSEVKLIGDSRSGYIKDLSFKISPEKAVELAGPYLDLSYELRVKNRSISHNAPLNDYVVQKGKWYYVTRDNYPYKYIGAYKNHAVKVNVNSGTVIPPE